jgi:hypothetical protein
MGFNLAFKELIKRFFLNIFIKQLFMLQNQNMFFTVTHVHQKTKCRTILNSKSIWLELLPVSTINKALNTTFILEFDI